VTLSVHAAAAIENSQLHAALQRELDTAKEGEEASRMLAAIVESSDDAIVSKDLNGIITSWNQGAERIFNYTAAEAIGQPVTILIPPDCLDEEPDILNRIRRGERIDHYETIRHRKDGSRVDVSLSVSPVVSHGRVVGASKILRDITDRKRNEQALKDAAEALNRAKDELELRVNERTASLREAIDQLEEFSYTVSHDLRAPLRAMSMYSKTVLADFAEKLASDPEVVHCLKRIGENASRMDRMIQDVLAYGRVARNGLILEPVSLDKLVRELVQHYPEMQSPKAEIRIDPLMDVVAHEPCLTQAISNLICNAVKFVAPGEVPKVTIWTERHDDQVRLCLEDNGIGIDPAYQHRLFNMFERIHPDLEYEGSGVGLAIVRKAVERMRGKAGVVSDGVSGSRFWIQLPAPEEQ